MSKTAQKWARSTFFHFLPHFVHSAYKISILICHKGYFIRKLKMSSHMAHLSSANAKNEPKMSQKQFFPLSTLFCSQCIQTINFDMSHDISATKMQNELLNSSFELNKWQKWAKNEPEALFSIFCPILFIVKTNYQFWWVTTYIYINLKKRSKNGSFSAH